MRIYGYSRNNALVVKLDVEKEYEGEFTSALQSGQNIAKDVMEEISIMDGFDSKNISFCLVSIDGQKKSPSIARGN